MIELKLPRKPHAHALVRAAAFVLVFATAAAAAPVILTERDSTRAVAFDAVTKMRDPFTITQPGFVGADRRTRVMLLVLNLDLLAGEGVNALSADAEDGAGRRYELTVEDVRAVRGFGGLTQVTVLLRPEMESAGDVLVRVNLHGVSSNRARISVGRATPAPADDAGSGPNPAPAVPPAATPTPTPTPFTGPAAEPDAVRFLEQASWGPTPAEVARVRQIGFKAWLDEQFSTPATSYPTAMLPLAPGDSAQGCPQADAAQRNECLRDNYSLYPLQTRFFQNSLYGPDQLRQRVSFALHQILVVSYVDISYPAWMGYYLQTLDRNSFGNYRTLLGEITLNPAMGEFLNMRGNVRTNPNENFAREILQLFSTGTDELNLDGTPKLDAAGRRIPVYDQDDVTNFARVFTGWNLAPAKTYTNANGQVMQVANYQDPMIVTNSNNHDLGAKTLLNGFQIAPFAGTTTQQRLDYANTSLNGALDNVFNHPNVGPFVGKQLIQHLVTSNPSPAYVERVARVFNNDCDALYSEGCANRRGNLAAVVRAILLDPEARGAAKTDPKYGRLREPVQFITNALRAFGPTAAGGAGQSDGVLASRSSRNFPQALDQNVFAPATVFSYYTPLYEVPGTGLLGPAFEILSTSTALQRHNTVNTFVYQGVTASAPDRPAGTALNFAALEAQAANPAQMIETLNALLLHGTMTEAMKSHIASAAAAIPTTDAQFARKRAQAAAYLVLTSPQFQVQR